jgi:predicted NBD/HSP70 family sugar kinase
VRVVQEVRRRGIATRDVLMAATGVSKTQLSRLIGPLVRDGFLAQSEKVAGRIPVQLAPGLGALVGVDVALGEIVIAVSDAAYGLLNDPRKTRTVVPITDPGKTLAKVADVIAGELQACRVTPSSVIGVGVGLPGPVRRVTGVPDSESILPGWSGLKVNEMLERELQERCGTKIRCVVANDGSLGGLGVYTRAVFRDPTSAPEDLIYLRITHGIGAGLIMKGHLVTGGSGFAGEIGHVRVASSGPLCPRCGARGCLEALASTSAIAEEVRAATRRGDPGSMSIEEALASAHPARHHATWEAGWLVGLALAQACNLLNPTWAVIGGNMTVSETFMGAIRHALGRNALPQAATTVGLRTWERLFDGEPYRNARPDVGTNVTPELLGALAIVLDELGDRHVLPHVEQWFREGGPTKLATPRRELLSATRAPSGEAF